MSRFLVTGATGQIGLYLSEMLLARGDEVLGVVGPDGKPLAPGVRTANGSLDRPAAFVADNAPLDAIVHLAARSSVAASWHEPEETFDANARLAVQLVYAAARQPGLRFVHASSAEIFGNAPTSVQDEDTPIAPVSPYGVAKAAAHLAVRVARTGMQAPAYNLIFYLGESPRRAPHFVFRKITRTVAAIASGDADELVLGTTSVVRDFCHAHDLAGVVLFALEKAPPGDYVCSTGVGRTILDVALRACELAGVDPKVIRSDPTLVRANDVRSLVGDSSRIRALGWSPEVSFDALVREVLEHDIAAHRAARPGGNVS